MKFLFVLLSIITTYNHGTYESVCTVVVDAPQENVNELVDKFVYALQTDIKQLFTWAFEGTDDKGDVEKDAIALRYKDTYYDPETHYGRLLVDVIVPGLHTFKNMTIETTLSDTVVPPSRVARLDIDYSGNLLKMAYGTFTVTPITEQKTILSLDMVVRFGFFANLFVTRKVYKNVIEWRLEKIVDNIKTAAEKNYLQGTGS